MEAEAGEAGTNRQHVECPVQPFPACAPCRPGPAIRTFNLVPLVFTKELFSCQGTKQKKTRGPRRRQPVLPGAASCLSVLTCCKVFQPCLQNFSQGSHEVFAVYRGCFPSAASS